ncbi:hypothetical protein FOMPIDRAFT_1049059 [Fomitopsis schrenkii]|uniref:Uncharacterized protein n=1 Tax=Fomitopsis schrenkii TaxID=2126942 RepID=S8FI46_FOMSC|nr:hypothetical protein FOMPIDRAFT_1049059 [Fomitopsis schrenkii]
MAKGFCSWLLDTVTSASDVYILWVFLIRGHGNVFGLLVFPKVYELEYASTSVTICVVQIFYVHGIWQLLERSPIKARVAVTVLPAAFSLLSLASGIVGVKIVT